MYSVTLSQKHFAVPFPGYQFGVCARVYKDGDGFPVYETAAYANGPEAREDAREWVRKQEGAAK
jgi:hypothetical protein